MRKVYMLKVGTRWALGGSGGLTTDDPSKAKLWAKASHVKNHVTNVRQERDRISRLSKRRLVHEYDIEVLKVVTCSLDEIEEIEIQC